MKRIITYITGLIALLMGFVACEQKELFLHSPKGNIPVNVEIHWDSVPSDMLVLPKDMTVHWYPASSHFIASDMGVFGGKEWLNADIYDVMCLDFNRPVTLAFRSNGTREDFEVYNIRMTGTYNVYVPQLPGGETTVAEAYPYQFYIDSRSQTINTKNVPVGDTLTVHFYPKNVLKEFTFMVYDVIGGKNMIKNSGAISGMSGSLFPASGKLASTPSTILFSRVETIRDAQTNSRWTEIEKALFAAKNPNWASSDTLVGWTRDWITGKFVTFGPLNTEAFRFRLTVETLNQGNSQHYGSWGYWHGQWENTVAAQIDSAMGKNGTLEEQLAWRKRNGGYDIILYNDHRLVVPEGGGDVTNGGFTVGVDDWGEIISVPTGRSSSNSSRNAKMRSSINTYETIPDFVVNGIYSGDGSFIFNEQYVYKPESGLIWDYQPKKFWPSSGEIDFYAYAPAGVKNLVRGLNNNTVPPVLKYVMPYKEREEPPPGTGEPPTPLQVDEQEDLLVAVQNRSAPQTMPVPMNFRHAFSRVTVKAKTDQNYSNYRIKVVRVDLRNLYTSGELTLNKDDTSQPISTGIPMEQTDQFRYGPPGVTLWQNLDSLASYRFKLIAPVITIEDEYTTLLRSDDGIFVMPQIIGNTNNTAVVYVEYDVYTYSLTGGEQYDRSLSKLLPLPVGFAFEIGRQYELHVILNVP
ncbi:MAG: fimbrillin family protein [Dysgonamonadaceae bacterium]|jgi:hypothetical protein|nr:fimbrillin family protein [Dysgonamonadaceae bacterium]